MEQIIACSLTESGVRCGEAVFISQVQYQLVVMGAILFSLVIAFVFAAVVIEYENKQFKKKMRDLGYGNILKELYSASEKWIPEKVITKSGVKNGREVP